MNISYILNNPNVLDLKTKWTLTNRNEIVIYDELLAYNALKSKKLIQYDFISNLKLIGHDQVSISYISDYFKNSPLLLRGSVHIKSRLEYSRFYEQVENLLKNILPNFTDSLFNNMAGGENALLFIDSFLSLTFKKIIALELNCYPEEIPDIPQSHSVFKFVPSAFELRKFNHELNSLYKFILKRTDNKNAWLLLSIIIMGESLRSILLYSLIHFKEDYTNDISKLFDEVSAISIIPRKALCLFKIDNLEVYKNQSVFISPFLIKFVAEKNKKIPLKNSLAFGFGIHSCPGKSIAKMISMSFLKSYLKYSNFFSINLDDGCFYRDFSLKVK